MIGFFESQRDFILLVWGLALVLLASVCLGGKHGKDAISWRWLGLFGLTHGIGKWIDLIALATGSGGVFLAIRSLVSACSFVFLAEFGRASLASVSVKTPGRWVIAACIALAGLSGLLGGWPGLDTASQYALCLPGGLAAGAALVLTSRRSPPGARMWLSPCGVAMGLYALATGVVVPRANFFPASVLNYDSFLQTLGFPVQLLRGILAVCIALAFWKYYRAMYYAKPEDQRLQVKASYAALLPVALVVVLTGGWIVTNLVGRSEDARFRHSILSRTQTAAAAVDLDCVKSFTCSSQDEGTANYLGLKQQLMAIGNANPDTRFVYLTRLVDSKIKFLVESEPDDSKDHSPIGSVYDSASPEFAAVFTTGIPVAEGPYPDDWGVWVSGVVPLKDPGADQVVAVLGMDIDARDWAHYIHAARLGPIGITGLISLMLIGFFAAANRIRESAERILDSEQIYRSLVECSPNAVAMFDAEGRYLALNTAGLDAMGWNESDVIGKPFTDVWPENDRPAVADAVGRALRGERNSFEAEYIRSDGRSILWFVSLNPVVEQNGRISRLVGISMDITDRKHAEEAIRRSKTDAEQANAAKSDFLARMSHEIRTPMNGVIGMAHLLMGTELTPQQRGYAQIVRISADALLALINDILDFSKIEAGKLELRPSDFDLTTAVEEVVEMLAQRAAEKGIELAAVVEPSVPARVRGDGGRFRQILVNLVGNAVKFTNRGEVVVRVERVSQTATKTVVRVTVRDTGIGISEEDGARLFQSFSQVDTSNTRKYGGTGLGLAISKRLAEMMSGQIGVQSRKGRGSTFWFTVEFKACEQPAAARDPNAPDLHGLRVLVVDDSAASREVICEQLASWGFQSEVAGDGHAALEVLRRRTAEGRPFGTLIVDSQISDMSGPELARAVRDDPGIRKNVRIVMTLIGAPLDPETMASAGIASCLTKPVRQSRLFDAIVEAMGRDAGVSPAAPKTAAASNLAASAQTRGAEILLAEDNEINQILAAEILRVAGYRYEIARNGQEVADALTKKPFDLVLMDCQMPEVDGLEATRRIRRKESEGAVLSPRGGRLPIIALTANALSGERERCLEAGMDGYLSKPIVPEEMIRTIESALSPQAQSGVSGPDADAEPAAAPVSPADGRPPFDLDELLKRCMGNRDFMAKMLDKFAHSVGADMERLEQAVSQGDLVAAAKAAHMLKGMGANLSARGMQEAAMELERACHAGRPDEATSALALLKVEVRRCRDFVPEVLAESPTR